MLSVAPVLAGSSSYTPPTASSDNSGGLILLGLIGAVLVINALGGATTTVSTCNAPDTVDNADEPPSLMKF